MLDAINGFFKKMRNDDTYAAQVFNERKQFTDLGSGDLQS